jgi:glycosyltransferase involved in cell wall biosynthesis
MNASCIIPMHNEKNRVINVITAVKKCKYISEIICVDDGSTDGSSKKVKKTFKNVALIKLSKNIGKSGAILAGARVAKNPYLLLMDADLNNIDFKKIDKGIEAFRLDEKIKMVIFKMNNFMIISKLLRHNILLSGNVIIYKADLIRAINIFKPKGYELETAVNQYMMVKNHKVVNIPFDAKSLSPISKNGLFWVIKRDLKMYPSLIRLVGIKNFIKQSFYFARKELS